MTIAIAITITITVAITVAGGSVGVSTIAWSTTIAVAATRRPWSIHGWPIGRVRLYIDGSHVVR